MDYTDEQIGLLKHNKGAESQVSSAMASAKKPETLVSPNKYTTYDRGRLEVSEGLGFDR